MWKNRSISKCKMFHFSHQRFWATKQTTFYLENKTLTKMNYDRTFGPCIAGSAFCSGGNCFTADVRDSQVLCMRSTKRFSRLLLSLTHFIVRNAVANGSSSLASSCCPMCLLAREELSLICHSDTKWQEYSSYCCRAGFWHTLSASPFLSVLCCPFEFQRLWFFSATATALYTFTYWLIYLLTYLLTQPSSFAKKLEWCPYHAAVNKCDGMSIRSDTQYQHWTDRRTDGFCHNNIALCTQMVSFWLLAIFPVSSLFRTILQLPTVKVFSSKKFILNMLDRLQRLLFEIICHWESCLPCNIIFTVRQ